MFSWANKVRVFAHWKYSYMHSHRKIVNFLCGSNILMVVVFFLEEVGLGVLGYVLF